MEIKRPTLLVILDGWGYRENPNGNAIANARKPFFDFLWQNFPHTILHASGQCVGLLPGMIGNSEVGHLAIGAGRTIPQAVTRIHNAIDDGSFFKNEALIQSLKKLKKSRGRLHLMGLLSDAGVHSHEKHLFAFMKAARDAGIKQLIIHPFLDGRDTPPKSSAIYLERLDKQLGHDSFIGSIHGRFYAMDRDKNWQRTEQSYTTLTETQPIEYTSWHDMLEHYYEQNITDEFVPPTQLSHDGIIRDGDGIIFFNFRPDRARQLTKAFMDPAFKDFQAKRFNLAFFLTPTDYGLNLPIAIMFKQTPVDGTLKEILSNAGKTIFSIAETEKYAHVTYFFSGGHETPWPHEKQVLIPSIHAKNYISHSEMSAQKITDAVLDSLKHDPKDFYLINYANADMVGHSGNFEATVKAVECLDQQLKQLYDCAITEFNGTMMVTSDHGNAEEKVDEKTGQPKTAHTTNDVPFIIVAQSLLKKELDFKLKSIADIAPFILEQITR